MAKAIYWQRGETIDFVNSGATDIEANTIVAIGTARVGVAGTTIKAGETGSLFVEGVFILPHDTAGAAITVGAKVYWDTENSVVTTSADNGKTDSTKVEFPAVGWATEGCAATDDSIKVKLA